MRGSGRTPVSVPRPWQGMLDVALHAAALDIAVVWFLWCAHVIQATQAILPMYYPLLGTLYRCVPALWVLHALLMLTVAGVAFASGRRLSSDGGTRRGAVPFYAIAAASLVSSWVLPAALVTVAGFAALHLGHTARRFDEDPDLRRGSRAMVRRLLALDRWSALGALVDVVLIAALVGGLVSVLEGLFYTSWFTTTLFSLRDFARFQAYALANAVVYCSVRAALALLIIAVLALVSRRLVRRGWLAARWLPAGVCGLLCAAACLFGLQLIGFTFGEELRSVGLEPAVIAVSLVTALGGTAVAVRNLQVQISDLRNAYGELLTFRSDLMSCVNAVSFATLTALAALRDRLRLRGLGGRTFHYAGGIASASALASALLVISYPKLHDYSTVAVHLYSTVVVLLAFVIACLAGHLRQPVRILRFRRGPLAAGLGVVLLALGLVTGLARANTRVLVNEYSVINRVFVDQLPGLAHARRSDLGMTATHDPALQFRPRSQERLPASPGVRASAEAPPPIILILGDAMRPDHLGAYGHRRPTSPYIDRFARDAVVFERAYSASTATSCGVRCMFAGRYASRFMLETHLPRFFTSDLLRHGYRRFVLSVWPNDYNAVCMAPFRRGLPPKERDRVSMRPLQEAPDHKKAVRAIEEIDRLEREGAALRPAQRGWFLYLHLTATHFPWVRREGARSFGPTHEDMYDQSVNYTDTAVGLVLEALRARGLYDKAVIAVVADHGTGLMEHGRYAGFYCYEEQIRVPMIIKVPGVAPRRVREPVSLIDLAPTLVNLFERDTENRFHGISLLPLMTGESTSSGRTALFNLCAFNDAYSLLWKGRWKYIFHRQKGYRQLYDLERDAAETENLVDQRPELDEKLQHLLGAFLWHGRGTYNNPYHFKPFVQTLAQTAAGR